MAQGLTFLASGDTGLTIKLGELVDRKTSTQVLRLREAIDSAALPGVIETVPTYLSVLVHYDPLRTSQSRLISAIEQLEWGARESGPTGSRTWALPICFAGREFAPDLEHIAAYAGVTKEDVVADILNTEQRVYMIGFAPGLPYMGDLPERLALSRRETPVPKVPQGSVLIATGKTVIYPNANPTGWYVVGRTPVRLFEPARDDPVLLRPGDSVRFRDVPFSEFEDIEARIAQADYDPHAEARI